jgi:hypothetical protein
LRDVVKWCGGFRTRLGFVREVRVWNSVGVVAVGAYLDVNVGIFVYEGYLSSYGVEKVGI